MKENELTPIEEYQGILLKRDDYFQIGGLTNGGKLRQALFLIYRNLDLIREKYDSNVVCSCSNKSPQSAIISEVCKLYGLKCKIVTYKTKVPNINLSIALKNGAELYGTKAGWNSVIESTANKLNGFNIKMGFASEDIIEANIPQVQNLPEHLDILVVPVGSGFNFISILKGLLKYQKKVDKIIGVYVGKDPRATLKTYLPNDLKYTLIQYPSNYSNSVKFYGEDFDEIYEAKAYDWLKTNIDIKDKKVLLWVVGKRNYNFKPFYELEWKN